MAKKTQNWKPLAEQQWGAAKAQLIEVTPGVYEVRFPGLMMPLPNEGDRDVKKALEAGYNHRQVLMGACRAMLLCIGEQLK